MGGGGGRLNYLYFFKHPCFIPPEWYNPVFRNFAKEHAYYTKLAAWAQTVNNDLLMCIPTCTEGQLHIASYLDR